MAESVIGFRWVVWTKGHTWIERPHEQSTLWLCAAPPGARNIPDLAHHRVYLPLRHTPHLFLKFAFTPPTPEGILGFANAYGLLGIEDTATSGLPPSAPLLSLTREEPLEAWQAEIVAMRDAVELWHRARGPRRTAVSRLRDYIGRQPYPDISGDWLHWDAPRAPAELLANAEKIRLHVPDDVMMFALFWMEKVVNERLLRRLTPRLIWNKSWTTDGEGMSLHFVPENLIGALWLQLAQAIGGAKDHRQCDCGTWFLVQPPETRSRRKHCSDKCKQQAYRRRQAQARRLFNEGRDVESIADILGVGRETVRNWTRLPDRTPRQA